MNKQIPLIYDAALIYVRALRQFLEYYNVIGAVKSWTFLILVCMSRLDRKSYTVTTANKLK